ncbi:MAG: type II toxin-antitoxin system PemK/MazF family toxin [Silvanigrellaceae bacterium]|nr:type II toxin-antitoxin system PemK/MazF family toxin [Silvanigrellaceae bacterium]
MVSFKRFDIVLVSLDPSLGFEIQKTRPCLIISPDEINKYIKTVIIAPMTSTQKDYPTRILITFEDITGNIVLDQIRTIDKSRILKTIGKLENVKAQQNVLDTLVDMFTF